MPMSKRTRRLVTAGTIAASYQGFVKVGVTACD
jgi:hypothetical protein